MNRGHSIKSDGWRIREGHWLKKCGQIDLKKLKKIKGGAPDSHYQVGVYRVPPVGVYRVPP